MSKQTDSYWRLNPETKKMEAICPACLKGQEGWWYWNGASAGYGNYDLKCSACGADIHKRGENE